ncbi:MAG: thermonuclease family protein [Desulfuromonadales bacterium]|nr:thermonuclease family protein [Desulfuromonadales bacterium]
MSRHARTAFLSLLCLLLPLLIVAVVPAQDVSLAGARRGTVTWVYDGDTLHVDPIGKVRLLGIDCPERTRSPERDRKFTALGADPARLDQIQHAGLRYNIATAKGKSVTLQLDRQPYDRHGRLLAYVVLPDGRLLNRLLLEEGLAVVYRRFDFARKDDFLEAEAEARQAGVGLWQ